jgi:transcription elongation factor GreA
MTMTEKPIISRKRDAPGLKPRLRSWKQLAVEMLQTYSQAKELGDISESGEYEDAKNKQAFLEGRIREVRNILNNAQMIDEENSDTREVRVGSSVTIR